MYRFALWLCDPRNLVWTTPALASVIAVALALAAAGGNAWIPPGVLPDIERGTLDTLLGVIASSMLSVTTFSLGIMLSAFASASSGATPRATELVMGDDGTRVAIASFIAAFIYAVIAQTALGLGYYGPTGRFILFVFTAIVLAYLIFTLVNWVRTLTQLGRLGNTLGKIEAAAEAVIDAHRAEPCMGAVPAAGSASGAPVTADVVGYITHINMDSLQQLAAARGWRLHLRERPGAFVMPDTVLARVQAVPTDGAQTEGHGGAEADPEALAIIHRAFVIAGQRSYDQDPRFGLIVLSEVAQRALSPAVNDPGTAIHVMTILTRLLFRLSQPAKDEAAAKAQHRYPDLTVLPLEDRDFVFDGFDPIARDGAGLLEVGMRMQKNLAGLARGATPALAQAAREQSEVAMARALEALTLETDRQRLRQAHGAPLRVAED